MPSYDIEIIETASKIVTVEADSESDAVRLVNDKYRNQDILLDTSDGDVNHDYEIKAYRDDVDEDSIRVFSPQTGAVYVIVSSKTVYVLR